MITAIVGTVEDEPSPLRGIGKTLTGTYYAKRAYMNDKVVFSNFYTLFSKQINMKQMIDLIINGNLKNALIIIDEMQVMLNSLGAQHKVVKFVDRAVAQTRKPKVDIIWISQRFLNVHARLRLQTDIILKPKKYHYDMQECKLDRCEKKHLIAVYMVTPKHFNPIVWLKPEVVGKWYNTQEIIFEDLKL